MDKKDIAAIVDAIVSHERFDTLFTTVAQNTTDIKEMKQDIAELKEAMHGLTNAVDALATHVHELTMEYAAIKNQVNRHEAWFKQIADHIGIQLAQ